MSDTAPLILVLLLVSGIITWGIVTDWTFSGLVPREGAKCTPDEGDKDENAKLYVYDEDEECTFIKRCKKDWEPNSSNTACEFIKSGEVCTANTLYIANAASYKFNPSGVCNLAKTCKTGWNPSTDAKTCIEDEWVLPTESKYQAHGYPVDTNKKEAKFSELEATTIEGCRSEAKTKGAQMIGFRAVDNTTKAKSCWVYDEPGMDTTKYSIPATPQPTYWVECTDTSNNVATSLCTKS
tara:strand:- start:281 stop:994 length:714 start_codon:yes stop_codon:yes gene_type:complete